MLIKDIWNDIVDINNRINSNIAYVTDIELFDKSDFWEIVDTQGDCDDYAVTKRKMLREKYPDNHGDFRLATCWTEGREGVGAGGYHAVLVVLTDDGDYVLDNRYVNVVPWESLPYKWHRRELPGSKSWEVLKQV